VSKSAQRNLSSNEQFLIKGIGIAQRSQFSAPDSLVGDREVIPADDIKMLTGKRESRASA
jgi:hypothetical protein